MTVLGCLSKAVIDRHYALRDHEDDVRLAKMLVKVVLGETAAWCATQGVLSRCCS